jgi:hypothetical protein
MALTFRNVAKLCIPAGPRNFSSCGGRLLRPLLFVAVYFYSRMDANSCWDMRCCYGLVRGVYVSGMMSSSWKRFLLYAVKSSSAIAMSSLFF